MTEADRPTQNQSNGGSSGEAAAAGDDADTAPAPQVEAVPPSSQKNELARIRDQLLRTAADFDNFRKRSRREMEDAQRRGRESAIKDLLPVFDNLERAASHAETTSTSQDAKSVADGLRIVLKQFHDTLDKMGVKRIVAIGVPFDPAVHEAIQHLPSADHPSGIIMAEVQPGYMMGDHLIRAAMVVVSKGSPSGASPLS